MIVAKYLRISNEDVDLRSAGKEESDSIANQRNLLDAFISQHSEFTDAGILEFCDDGWSGKNFERPGVKAMLEQVKRGKIQCIAVKDLSRFGRDYLTVGNYISKIFPFMGVRFISVNDGLDSARPGDVDSLDTSFKALLYDLYSRDLSRKVRSAKLFRAQRGDFLSPFAPYGYIKSQKNHNLLVIDPPAAEVVRRIFNLVAQGHSTVTVARTLNDEGVLTPMLYKRAAGCSRTHWPSVSEENFWTKNLVTKIIRDKRYTGMNIYGKRTRDVVGSSHTVKCDQKNWITVVDTHEAIISQDEFDHAQDVLREFRERDGHADSQLLARKLRCGVCGHILSRYGGKEKYFCCQTMRVLSGTECIEVHISEKEVLDEILESLHIQASLTVDREKMQAKQREAAQQNKKAALKLLSDLQEGQALRNRQIRELYEAFALGEVNKEDYLVQKRVLNAQNEKCCTQITELQAALDTKEEATDAFAENFKRFGKADKVSDEIIRELLKEVIVYPHGRLEVVWNCQDTFITA